MRQHQPAHGGVGGHRRELLHPGAYAAQRRWDAEATQGEFKSAGLEWRAGSGARTRHPAPIAISTQLTPTSPRKSTSTASHRASISCLPSTIPTGVEYSNPEVLRSYASQATPVTISPGQTTKVTAQLIQTGGCANERAPPHGDSRACCCRFGWPSSAGRRAAASQAYPVSGIVLDSVTGQPLPGFAVTLTPDKGGAGADGTLFRQRSIQFSDGRARQVHPQR